MEKAGELQARVAELEALAPQILDEYRARLKEKTADLLDGAQLDENRLAAEIVLYADRICIDEEMVKAM